MKHPLARALSEIGMDATDVAGRLGVDPKTVGRWLAGRVPYPRHRAALAELTNWQPRDLWPDLTRPTEQDPARHEIRTVYPNRSSVPTDLWRHHFATATSRIDILAYSALFLAEDTHTQRLLQDKARAGLTVRIALGDPDGQHVARRGADENIHDLQAARIRNALILFRPLSQCPGVELRLHDTVLYNSLYRADDSILVNSHIYGYPASHAPVFHMHRRHDTGAAATYLESFEQVWNTARST